MIVIIFCYLYVKGRMVTMKYDVAIESYAFDILIVFLFVEILSFLTSYASLLYLLVFLLFFIIRFQFILYIKEERNI